MDDILEKLKKAMPNLENVFYHQDNAGCYHSASTIIGAKLQAEKAGVTLKRLDFSDLKEEKGHVTGRQPVSSPTCKSSLMKAMTSRRQLNLLVESPV